MGRKKIDICYAEEKAKRQRHFTTRMGGLFNKAHELSVLCGVPLCLKVGDGNEIVLMYENNCSNKCSSDITSNKLFKVYDPLSKKFLKLGNQSAGKPRKMRRRKTQIKGGAQLSSRIMSAYANSASNQSLLPLSSALNSHEPSTQIAHEQSLLPLSSALNSHEPNTQIAHEQSWLPLFSGLNSHEPSTQQLEDELIPDLWNGYYPLIPDFDGGYINDAIAGAGEGTDPMLPNCFLNNPHDQYHYINQQEYISSHYIPTGDAGACTSLLQGTELLNCFSLPDAQVIDEIFISSTAHHSWEGDMEAYQYPSSSSCIQQCPNDYSTEFLQPEPDAYWPELFNIVFSDC
ncbi:hypothetical protein KI387_038991 [Taxus chinensis]|uniref:MADS-box domain-containing protein n=1 Tax=Taxus chinensis TaxID=29808 RepID=A0AA38FAK3_TAXCH|nr:hypothetical protein KI387_038991 [Taxus chinensis]